MIKRFKQALDTETDEFQIDSHWNIHWKIRSKLLILAEAEKNSTFFEAVLFFCELLIQIQSACELFLHSSLLSDFWTS